MNTEEDMLKREVEFQKYGKRIADILLEKNTCYGNSVVATGKEGIYVRLFDKFERVKNVSVTKNDEVTDESIADTIGDIAGYSVLWLMIHEKSSVFFNEDGTMKFTDGWINTIWATKLRTALLSMDRMSAEEFDEILICQRCGVKSFDIHHRFCYNCDDKLADIEIERNTDVTEFTKKDYLSNRI